jgi:4-hydroxy-3-polyprenylbenzoate decarboxylase
MPTQNHIILALTGASGAPYALRLLELMLKAGVRVDLIFSKAAQMVLAMESELEIPARPQEVAALFQAQHGVTQRGPWWYVPVPWAPWRRSRRG